MKHSIRILAAFGLAAVTAVPAGLRAAEMDEADMKVWRESVDERLKGLHNEVAEFNKVRLDFFVQPRFDYITDPNANVAGSNAGTGTSGMYVRRAEGKFTGMLQPNVIYSLGFDFSEVKLKDAGIEVKGLPLLPFMEVGEWDLKLGQYRIPFGIMPQTSSSAVWFAERAYHQEKKLTPERVMGGQGKWGLKSGIVNLALQAGVFNDIHTDQAATQNKLATAFADQATKDQDLSGAGRLGAELTILKGLLPEKSKLVLGGSYGRDSVNTAWRAQRDKVAFNEIVGADFSFALTSQFTVQGEWVAKTDHTSNVAGVASQVRSEAWYVDTAIDILPFFASEIAKGDKLELIARVDRYHDFSGAGKGWKSLGDTIAFGLKNSYWGGKSHTAVNYYIEAADQQFGGTVAGGPDQKIVIQQQFAFENGKAQWMEKEAE